MAEARGDKPRILIVDDTEAGRYILGRMLRGEGYEVIEATSGTDGLRLAIECSPALVVLDVQLPDVNGYEVCARLKAATRGSFVPVVQISAAFTSDLERAKGLEGGADAYVVQPVDPKLMLATVRSLLRVREAEDRARRSEARFRFLADAGMVLSTSRDFSSTVSKATSLAVPWLAGWSVAWFADDAETLGESVSPAMAHTHRDPALGEQVARLAQAGPPALEAPGQRDGTDDVLGLSAAQREALRALESRSVMWVPIFTAGADGSQIGVQLFGSLDRGFDEADRVLAEALAERVGVAVQTARLFRELRDAKLAAERAVGERESILAVVSHDLKTPLSSIALNAQLFKRLFEKESVPQATRALEIAGRIVVSYRRMSRLIEDLLDLERIRSGGIVIDRRLATVGALVADAVEGIQALARAKGVALETRLEVGREQALSCDPDRIGQIFSNLLGNAVKFTPEGGFVEVSVSEAGEFIRFAVRDSGQGIPAASLSYVFDRYFQADRKSGPQGGTGLGLSIAKGLVEAHGGRIWVESKPGEGATFFFELPRAQAAQRPSMMSAS